MKVGWPHLRHSYTLCIQNPSHYRHSCVLDTIMADNSKKQRKPDFNHGEICTLLEMYKANKDILRTKFSNVLTNQKKQAKWREITAGVNIKASPGVVRNVDEVKKKWSDLLQKAKKDNEDSKRPPTGGGKAPRRGIYSDIVTEIYGPNAPIFQGVPGGLESSIENCDSMDVSGQQHDFSNVSEKQHNVCDVPEQQHNINVCDVPEQQHNVFDDSGQQHYFLDGSELEPHNVFDVEQQHNVAGDSGQQQSISAMEHMYLQNAGKLFMILQLGMKFDLSKRALL